MPGNSGIECHEQVADAVMRCQQFRRRLGLLGAFVVHLGNQQIDRPVPCLTVAPECPYFGRSERWGNAAPDGLPNTDLLQEPSTMLDLFRREHSSEP